MEFLNNLEISKLKDLLEVKVEQYNQKSFIQDDPISIPHQFTKKQDIEITALLISLIAWGKRKMIIDNGNRLLEIMDYQPHDFILNYKSENLNNVKFVHRTFNIVDLDFIFRFFHKTYHQHNSLEDLFYLKSDEIGIKNRIINFRNEVLSVPHEKRSEKHIANPAKGSAAKRINMFLRWMVRKDNKGVDFGLWNTIKTTELFIPLDVHSGRMARELGLLSRKQDDWKALEELMANLQQFDANDPSKYDYALFGLGVNNEL